MRYLCECSAGIYMQARDASIYLHFVSRRGHIEVVLFHPGMRREYERAGIADTACP
jgi:hypothetical protein